MLRYVVDYVTLKVRPGRPTVQAVSAGIMEATVLLFPAPSSIVYTVAAVRTFPHR